MIYSGSKKKIIKGLYLSDNMSFQYLLTSTVFKLFMNKVNSGYYVDDIEVINLKFYIL